MLPSHALSRLRTRFARRCPCFHHTRPHLQAVQAPTRTQPLRRLPPLVLQGLTTHRDLDSARLAHKLAGSVRTATRGLFGGNRNRFDHVSIPPAFLVHNPSQFRAAIFVGGFPGSCSIVHSTDPNQFYTCAADRDLVSLVAAYKSCRTLAHHSDSSDVPALAFSGILDFEGDLSTEDLVAAWQGVRSELCRLEDKNRRWYRKRSFAVALRHIDTKILAKLSSLPLFPCAGPLPPPPTAADGFARRHAHHGPSPPDKDGWTTVGAPVAPSHPPPVHGVLSDDNPYSPLEHIHTHDAAMTPDA